MYCETNKFKLDVFILLSLILFLGSVLWCSSSPGNVITLDNFEGDVLSLNWPTSKISTTPSGRSFLGPFGAETVDVIITVPNNCRYAILELDVYAIGEWPPFDSRHPVFPVAMHAEYTSSVDETTFPLIDSDLMNHVRRIETNTLGYTEPNRVYHFREPFTGSGAEWYDLTFGGSVEGMQWGLDNVVVHAAIPEPSTGTTVGMVIGVLLIGWAVWRLRKQMTQISRRDAFRTENAEFRRGLWLESRKVPRK